MLMENFRKKQRGPIVINSDWFRFEAFVERLWSKIKESLIIEQHGNFADELT